MNNEVTNTLYAQTNNMNKISPKGKTCCLCMMGPEYYTKCGYQWKQLICIYYVFINMVDTIIKLVYILYVITINLNF